MPTTAKELEDQIALRRARFESIVAEVRAVLVDDIPNWAQREAKEAFVGQPEAAASLDAGALKSYKSKILALGTSASEALGAALADPTLWLEGPAVTGNPRTVRDAAGVWSKVVSLIDEPFNAVLAEHGLGGEEPSAFKGPVYFVGGRYFPTLAEHYWKLRAELVELQSEADALTATETRSTLLDRWDQA